MEHIDFNWRLLYHRQIVSICSIRTLSPLLNFLNPSSFMKQRDTLLASQIWEIIGKDKLNGGKEITLARAITPHDDIVFSAELLARGRIAIGAKALDGHLFYVHFCIWIFCVCIILIIIIRLSTVFVHIFHRNLVGLTRIETRISLLIN